MNKKIILLVILVLSLTMIFAGCNSVSKSVVNGDFSSYEDGAFTGWTANYETEKDSQGDIGIIKESTSDQDKGRGSFLVVEATKAGANFLSQPIKLKQGATYRLSADFKTNASISGENSKFRGAFVGFLEDPSVSVEVRNSTQGNWQNGKEIYFTPTTNKPLTLVVGIGNKDIGKAKGTAYFDNIAIEEVNPEDVPTSVPVQQVKTGGDRYSLEDGGSIAFVVVGAILTCMIVAAFMYVYRKNLKREMLSTKKMLSPIALFIYMMLVAFIIRFLLAIFTNGMVAEMAALTTLAQRFNTMKLTEVISTTGTTLPAGMLYILFILNGIAKLLHIGGDGFNLLLRLPYILADLVAIYLVYSIVSKRTNEHTGVFVAGLYAVLPSFIMVSTGWGMTVSIVSCLIIALFYLMLNKNYIGVTTVYAVALLFSNELVLILPLVLAFLINAFVKYSDTRLKIGISSLVALVAFYLITMPLVMPFLGKGKPFYYFSVMFKDLTAANVLTANAFNLYGMLGYNMQAIPKAINILNYIFVVALMVGVVLLYLRNRDRLNVVLMSAFMLISVATLSPRGSVEMLALGVAVLFFYAVIANSRRIYALVGGFSTLSFLNTSLIMSNSGFISNQLNSNSVINFFKLDPTFIVFSVIAVIMTLYLGYVVIDVCFRERDYEITPLEGKLKDDIRTRYELMKQNRQDRKLLKANNDTDNE